MAGVMAQVGQVVQVHQVAVTARVAVIPSGSNSGHSSSGSNSGSSSSVSKGGHSTSDPSTAPATAVSGRSVSASSVIQAPFEVGLSLWFIILALAGGTAIGRKAKKTRIGGAIMGADCSVSFGID